MVKIAILLFNRHLVFVTKPAPTSPCPPFSRMMKEFEPTISGQKIYAWGEKLTLDKLTLVCYYFSLCSKFTSTIVNVVYSMVFQLVREFRFSTSAFKERE